VELPVFQRHGKHYLKNGIRRYYRIDWRAADYASVDHKVQRFRGSGFKVGVLLGGWKAIRLKSPKA
jgi:hypothetical protein